MKSKDRKILIITGDAGFGPSLACRSDSKRMMPGPCLPKVD